MFQACEVKITKIDASSSPSRLSGKHLDEEGEGDGKKDEDGDRLEDVEDGHQDLLGAPQAGGGGAVDQGEHRREEQGDEHPQQGAGRVVGQVADVGRELDRRPSGREVDGHRLAQLDGAVQDSDDGRGHDEVEPVEPPAPQGLPQRQQSLGRGQWFTSPSPICARRHGLRPADRHPAGCQSGSGCTR